MTTLARPPSTPRARRSRLLWSLVLVAACLRAAVGFDLADGAHHVELAQRIAHGDVPFRDEMNVQVLGALPAAPFVWLWEHAVGTTGIVLASRIWFVLLAAAVGAVVHRLVRDHVSVGLAAVAVLCALVPQPYNLVSVSYNTAPGLLLLVGCAAGASTAVRPRRRRSLLCGAAAAGCALLNPLMILASVLTLVVVVIVGRRWATVGWVAVGAGAVSVSGLVVLAGFGFGAIGDSIDYTRKYQALRIPPGERLDFALSYYEGLLANPWVLAAAGCGLLALVPWPRRWVLPLVGRWVRPLLATSPLLLVAAVAIRVHDPADGLPDSGMTSGVLGLVLVVLATVPAAVVAAVRRDRFAGTLLAVSVVPLVAQAPVLAAVTSSSPIWGAPAAAVGPAVLAVAVTLGRSLGAFGPVWVGLAALLLASAHAVQPYRDVPPWEARLRTSGPLAGLLTGDSVAAEAGVVRGAIEACQQPGEGLLTYGAPGAYLFADGPADTNILWLAPFGPTNEATVSWLERNDREPVCVLVHRGIATRAPSGQWSTRVGGPDPVLDWVAPRYTVLDAEHGRYVVLRRNPPLDLS
ncbi:hypothetical protein LL946_13385 [Knoellia locipacati]|uniref:hypothetical protein n=1 Tax=Knoellia locipacati TaxID=882824 RepID=UPI00384E991F